MNGSLGPGPEFDLIRRFLEGARDTGREVRVGPGDDAAVIRDGIVLSTDLSIEGVHFRREWIPSFDIGWRCAAGALSDLAAMAAHPIGLLASIAVSADDAGDAGVEVMRGVEAAVAAVGGVLLGGDLTRSPGPLVLDVTVVGQADPPILRSGGRAGDELWVTGRLGAAAACVAQLLRGESPGADALAAFARPRPRIAEAVWLAERGIPRAMLDLSDGLAGDAGHIAAASGVAAVLEAALIPIHPAVLGDAGDPARALRLGVSGGEDYELCFAGAPGAVAAHAAEFEAIFSSTLTRVGILEAGEGVWWRAGDGSLRPIEHGGYQHFGGET